MHSVSIIIPVYNVSAYIQRCLESVIAQASDAVLIECLLVDDCSPDDSIAVAEAFISTYNGPISFYILHHEVNQGQSVARNTGIDASKGDYLLFLDADDHLVPGAVGLMFEALKTHPDADVVDGAFYHCEDRKTYPPGKDVRFLTNRNEILVDFYKGRLSLCAWNKLVRRDFLMSHVLYFAKDIVFEDIQWSNRLFHCINSILVLPDVTYIYEYNPTSTMNTTHINATKSIRSFVRVFTDLLNTPESAVYVDHKMFIFHYILNAMDILQKGYAGWSTDTFFIFSFDVSAFQYSAEMVVVSSSCSRIGTWRGFPGKSFSVLPQILNLLYVTLVRSISHFLRTPLF